MLRQMGSDFYCEIRGDGQLPCLDVDVLGDVLVAEAPVQPERDRPLLLKDVPLVIS